MQQTNIRFPFIPNNLSASEATNWNNHIGSLCDLEEVNRNLRCKPQKTRKRGKRHKAQQEDDKKCFADDGQMSYSGNQPTNYGTSSSYYLPYGTNHHHQPATPKFVRNTRNAIVQYTIFCTRQRKIVATPTTFVAQFCRSAMPQTTSNCHGAMSEPDQLLVHKDV